MLVYQRVDLSELSAATVRRLAGYLGDPPATGEVPQRDGDGETEALRSIKVEFDEELIR